MKNNIVFERCDKIRENKRRYIVYCISILEEKGARAL